MLPWKLEKYNASTKTNGTNHQNRNTKGKKEGKTIIIITIIIKIIMIIIIIIKKKLKLFHFDNYALTMAPLPRKLVRQIFWFPKKLYTSIEN